MKVGVRVLLFLLMPMFGGCSWLYYSCENLVSAPVDWFDELAFRQELKRLAREAWRKVEHDDNKPHSSAYEHGFKQGFVDYVESNGTGEPPAMPPTHLQRAGYRTPEAHDEIEDWYAGFRHGASVGSSSGLRDRFVVPIGRPPRLAIGEVDREQTIVFPPAPAPVPKESPTGR